MRDWIVGALALVLAAPAAAQNDWERVAESDEGMVGYVRLSDMAQGTNNRAASVWIKWDARRVARYKWRESKELRTIDCSTGRDRIEEAIDYYPDGSNHIFRFGSTNDIERIAPDTVMDAVAEVVCRDGNQ